MHINRKATLALAAALALTCVPLAMWGCSPSSQGSSSSGSAGTQASTSEASATTSTTDAAASGSTTESAYEPIVTTLSDGTKVQRTPSEIITPTQDATAVYNHPTEAVPYNTYFLKADQRGCESCHDDLAQAVEDMPYGHASLKNSLGINITVQMCVDCHSYGPGYQTVQYSFGSIIHGIHSDVSDATCMTCHDATNDGNGMQLWDVVKHNILRGITDVADVSGDFSYTQKTTITQDQLYDFDWEYWDLDYLRKSNTENGTELDQDMYDNWTITVSGEVNNQVTYKLTDLIKEAPSVTEPITMQCVYNPTGGPLLGNVNCTGIPLSWLLDKAGLKDDAGSFYAASPDGNMNAIELSNYEGQEALLVYQIDGQPLSWKNGYPVTLFIGGAGAPVNDKEVSDIIVNPSSDTEHHDYEGWIKEDGGWYNKPNVGFENIDEGQIIETGTPFTFEGFAAAWNENIDYIEFSMDKGETWTRCDVSDTTKTNWITWKYTWTPDADGAYVMRVRAVTESGLTTEEPPEIMVNAKTSGE